MLYGNGAVGGIVNEVSKLPDPDAPNIVQLAGRDRQPLPGRHRRRRRARPTARSSTGWSASGARADGPVDYSNDDAAAFMPSLTWAPDRGTSVTLLGYYQKNDTSPYIQFLSPYGTLWSAEQFANGDYLDARDLRRRAGVQLLQRQRAGGDALRRPSLRRGLERRRHLRYTESKLDYAQTWWAYDNFETGRYNPDGTINRDGEIADERLARLDRRRARQRRLRPRRDRARGDVRRLLHRRALQLRLGAGVQRGPIDPFDPGLHRDGPTSARSSTSPSTR